MAVALAGCLLGQAGAAELSEEEKSAGWKLLFNGETFEGWRNYNKKGVRDGWKIENGTMVHTKGGGDLITEDQFENFELKLEWKISEKGNSGIFFGVREIKGPIYFSGIEMQILDDENNSASKNSKHASGACYALYETPRNISNGAGEWNQVKIVKEGEHYQFFLNGTKTADFKLRDEEFLQRIANSKFAKWEHFAKHSRGHIGLQDHGDAVSFRNIKIRQLE